MTFDAVGVFGLTFDFLLKICLSILCSVGFLLLSPTNGKNIPGIIKKINKALGKVIYPKSTLDLYPLSDHLSNQLYAGHLFKIMLLFDKFLIWFKALTIYTQND